MTWFLLQHLKIKVGWLCHAMPCREWDRKHPLLLLLWWPRLGTSLSMGRQNWFWGNNNLYSFIWVFQCSLSVKRGQSLCSARRRKQLRHKKGRLDTRSSEITKSKRDALKFYSMSALLLQKHVTYLLLTSKLEIQGTPKFSVLESPFVCLLSWIKHRSIGLLGGFPALSNGRCLWELSEVKS